MGSPIRDRVPWETISPPILNLPQCKHWYRRSQPCQGVAPIAPFQPAYLKNVAFHLKDDLRVLDIAKLDMFIAIRRYSENYSRIETTVVDIVIMYTAEKLGLETRKSR